MPHTPRILEPRCEWSSARLSDESRWTEQLSRAELEELAQKLDTDDAGREQVLGAVRHRRYRHGRQAPALELTCQHGHVLAAVGSGGGEDDAVRALLAKCGRDLRRGLVAPHLEARLLDE